MSYIREIEPADAEGDLQEIYARIMDARGGRMPAVLKVFSIKPELLRKVEELNAVISFGGSTLGRRREEMLATLVSSLNGCHYWLLAHGEYLRAITRDDLLVYHLQRDHTLAEVDGQERAMLDYAAKLNHSPGQVGEADLEPLRAAGFDDQGVMDIVMMVALFNFMNRAADGLGVETGAAMEQTRARGEKRAQQALQDAAPPAGQAGG